MRYIFSLRIDKEISVNKIVGYLESLDFKRYYGLVRDMRKNGLPFIPQDMYEKLIGASHEWDSYVQVYLWKILVYQKILFAMDPGEIEVRSTEGIEGMEMVNFVEARKKSTTEETSI
jgi:hypothetical protein